MQVLKNSETCVRGLNQEPLDLSHLVRPDYENFLLSPTAEAIELSEIDVRNRTKPIHLIVPDGNWRQASKVAIRHRELRMLPRVKLTRPPGELPRTALRQEHFKDGMATLEAIAYALVHFEGAEVAARLFALYTAKLAATIEGRRPTVPIPSPAPHTAGPPRQR